MRVPEETEPFVKMPSKPEGAEWAPPAKVIRKVTYRFDGQGYLKDGYRQLFVLPADGGTAWIRRADGLVQRAVQLEAVLGRAVQVHVAVGVHAVQVQAVESMNMLFRPVSWAGVASDMPSSFRPGPIL